MSNNKFCNYFIVIRLYFPFTNIYSIRKKPLH